MDKTIVITGAIIGDVTCNNSNKIIFRHKNDCEVNENFQRSFHSHLTALFIIFTPEVMKWLIYDVSAFVFKENICDLLDCNVTLVKWVSQISVVFCTDGTINGLCPNRLKPMHEYAVEICTDTQMSILLSLSCHPWKSRLSLLLEEEMHLVTCQFRLTLISSLQFYVFIQPKIFYQQVFAIHFIISPLFCSFTFFVICHLLCKEEHGVKTSGNYVSAAQKVHEAKRP